MSTLELIVHELEGLSETRLQEAADIIRQISDKGREERRTALKNTSGWLTEKEAAEWHQAVEEAFEQVDPNEW